GRGIALVVAALTVAALAIAALAVAAALVITALIVAAGIALLAALVAVALAVAEVDAIRHDLGAAALIAVFVGPGADLQPSADHGHAALGEVAGDKFRGIAPGDNVDEVGLLLAGLAVGAEVPVHRQREGRHGDAAAGPPEL